MAMIMLNAVGGANVGVSQFMFLGTDSWALADAASLSLLASGGTTGAGLLIGATGGFAAPGLFLGISGPNGTSQTASFAFKIDANAGTFTLYDLPSDFPYLASLAGTDVLTPITSAASSVFVLASETLLNLSQICGIVSGGTAQVTLDTAGVSIPLINDSDIWVNTTSGTLFTFSMPGGVGITDYQYPFSASASFPSIGLVSGYIFAMGASDNSIYLVQPDLDSSSSVTISSPDLITVEALFSYGSTNLFALNFTNNQAQSINCANVSAPVFSPAFSLDLSSTGDSPAFSWMDPATGVYYQNLGGASLFANLSPMQF